MATASPSWYRQMMADNRRPSVDWATYNGISTGEFQTFLRSRPNYLSVPIYVEAGATLSHRLNDPIVAATSMCGAPSVDGGYNTYSPNALVKDRYYNFTTTTTSSLSLTTTGTLPVVAIDRALPKGFLIGVGSGVAQLTAAASQGATSLAVAKVYTNVTINNGDTVRSLNGYFYQGGQGSPTIKDLCLLGDPASMIQDDWASYEGSREYGCDAMAVVCDGASFENIIIDNFPGHGLYAASPIIPSSRYGIDMPWDYHELYARSIRVRRCLAGITWGSTDGILDGRIIAERCRDYGVRLSGYATQFNIIHTYGCGIGFWAQGNFYGSVLEPESCNYGAFIDDNAIRCQLGSLRAFSNAYSALYCSAPQVHIGSINIEHASSLVDSNLSHATGMAMFLGSWADSFICPAMYITATGGASGVKLGHNAGKTMTGVRLAGVVGGDSSGGDKGIHFYSPQGGNYYDLTTGGFDVDVYFENVTLSGCTLKFRGASSSTIRWPDSTTGTFATPNVPLSLDLVNNIQFLTY